MGVTPTSNSVEYLHTVLAQIQNLITQASQEGNTGKHQRIRVAHWVRKLRSQPTSNPTWLKSVLEYANVLLQMLVEGVIEEPFTKMPPQGPLPALPRYQVARLAKSVKQLARTRPVQSRRNSVASSNNDNSNIEDARAVAVVQTENKQIQTQEQDDQWEWQRVWKGAFDKMRQQLQLETDESEALAAETKELRALVEGYKKALDEEKRNQRDLEAKHLAEVENLRAVHSLELSNLQARHRQKLQEMTLQNEEKGFRESAFSSKSKPPNEVTAANADFLEYIDSFYSNTLRLTSSNKV